MNQRYSFFQDVEKEKERQMIAPLRIEDNSKQSIEMISLIKKKTLEYAELRSMKGEDQIQFVDFYQKKTKNSSKNSLKDSLVNPNLSHDAFSLC